MDNVPEPDELGAPVNRFQLRPYSGAVGLGKWSRRILIGALFLFCLVYGAVFALLFPYEAVPLTIPLVVLGGIAVWALPDAAKAPVDLLEFLTFGFLIALVMWPNYLAVALPGLPWITVQRLIAVPLVLVLLICVSVSAPFRSQLVAILQAAPLIWKLVCVFVFLQVLSIVFSDNKGSSLNFLVTAQTNWTAVFFASCFVSARPGRPERIAGLLCLMAVALGAIGIVEHRLNQVPWAGHTPSFLQVNDDSVERILLGTARGEGGQHRVQATYSTALGLSEYFALTMPFILHFATGQYRLPLRIAAWAAVPFLLWIVLLTQARVGTVGLLLSALVFPFSAMVLRWRRNPRSLVAASAVFFSPLLFGAALAITYIVPGLHTRVWGGGAEQLSTQSRVDQFHMGIPKLLSHPWGYGIGQGGVALGYTNAAGVLTIDSYSLRVALDLGVVGLVVFYSVFAAGLYYAARGALTSPADDREAKLFIPIGISLLSFIVIKSVFAQEDNQPIVFMLFGLLAALTWRVFAAKSAAPNDESSAASN